MSDFQVLRLHCQTVELWEAIKATANFNRSESNPAESAILECFRPVYALNGANREAKLDRVYVYEDDGRTYGLYSIVDHNRERRASLRWCWRYRVVNGEPVEAKAFPVSVREWGAA